MDLLADEIVALVKIVGECVIDLSPQTSLNCNGRERIIHDNRIHAFRDELGLAQGSCLLVYNPYRT